MEPRLDKEIQQRVSLRILADVYSCLKVVYKMNVDNLDSDVMLKVLENHFDLSEFEQPNGNGMNMIQYSICKPIHDNPLKYFNFSYRKPNR